MLLLVEQPTNHHHPTFTISYKEEEGSSNFLMGAGLKVEKVE